MRLPSLETHEVERLATAVQNTWKSRAGRSRVVVELGSPFFGFDGGSVCMAMTARKLAEAGWVCLFVNAAFASVEAVRTLPSVLDMPGVAVFGDHSEGSSTGSFLSCAERFIRVSSVVDAIVTTWTGDCCVVALHTLARQWHNEPMSVETVPLNPFVCKSEAQQRTDVFRCVFGTRTCVWDTVAKHAELGGVQKACFQLSALLGRSTACLDTLVSDTLKRCERGAARKAFYGHLRTGLAYAKWKALRDVPRRRGWDGYVQAEAAAGGRGTKRSACVCTTPCWRWSCWHKPRWLDISWLMLCS